MIWRVTAAILGHLGKATAAFCSCKSTSAGEDRGVGGNGLVVGGVLLGGAERQPPRCQQCHWLLCPGCAAAGLSNLTRSCTGPENTPRSTSKLTTLRLCPSATTDLGTAAEPPGECSEQCQFPCSCQRNSWNRERLFSGSVPKFPAPSCQAGVSSQPTHFLNESLAPGVARHHLQQEGAEPATLIGTSPPSRLIRGQDGKKLLMKATEGHCSKPRHLPATN